MKSVLTLSLALATCMVVKAQNPDQALARVHYSFTHIEDTTQKDRPRKENMLLVVGKNASVYTSYDKINQGIERRKQVEEQLKNQSGSNTVNIKIAASMGGTTSPMDYFYFVKENKLFTKERIFNNYIVEEPVEKIDWKISKDTASFSGVHCQKATTHFKGRNWIAWFAPEIPFQSGPWKLNGLPGLIIEAYDERNEVQFRFDGMEKVAKVAEITSAPGNGADQKMASATVGYMSIAGPTGMNDASYYLGNEIKFPEDAIRASRKEVDKLKEARDKDPQGFMKTQFAASGGMVVSGVRTMSSASAAPAQKKIELNNPIELPEKK